MSIKTIGMVLTLMAASLTAVAQDDETKSGYKPMPPKFTLEAEPKRVLENYPLGIIDEMAAFSHHGKAHQTVSLVNGLTGWVYEVHRGGNLRTFENPAGEEVTTMETFGHPAARTYTLVFDNSGKVIDVLYRDIQHEKTDSALLVQREAEGDSPSEAEFPPKQ